MKHFKIVASLAALAAIACFSVVMPSSAEDGSGPATIASFAGRWQMTIVGQTGCGFSTVVYYITLPRSGVGTQTSTSHTAGCGDGNSTSLPFVIQSVNADGSGRANLSCGAGCGFNLTIQLAPNQQVFNAVDVDAVNPGNFIEGTAVRQSW